MKILHTIASVNPTGGGPIEGVKQQASVWNKFGFDVEVASLDSPNDPWVVDSSVVVHALGPSLGAYGFSWKFVQWLRQNGRQYDVIVVNGIWAFNSFGTFLGTRGTNVPYVIFTHGMLDPWFKRRFPLKHLKKWLYWPWAEYRVLKHARIVLFTCEEERRLAKESFWLYRANERVVKYGTAGAPMPPGDEREVFLETFPHLKGKRLVLFLSRIHQKKGCDLALLAFAEAMLDPNYHLVMAGPDSSGLSRRLQVLAADLGIADRVSWPGMLTGKLKWGAFRASEVFLLPSHQENFGIVVAEALSCGLPVLISDKVNIWREIESARAGFVDTDSERGAKALLRQWDSLTNPEKALMAQRAQQCFVDQFEIHEAVASLVRVLGDVVSNSSRRRT